MAPEENTLILNMFTDRDIQQITSHGLSEGIVETQLRNFEKGFLFLNLVKTASVGDGICVFDDSQCGEYARKYEDYAKSHKIVKFVPASGAATRMFKDLFGFLENGEFNDAVVSVIGHLDEFAFAAELDDLLPSVANDSQIVSAIVSPEGLNLGAMPKALIKFHKYNDGARTALEEHLCEGAQYAENAGEVNIHFTVSPEHRAGFENLLEAALPEYGKKFGVKYNVSMSEQRSSTDTIAVNDDNTPFRNADGSLLFRPAGHGALIGNLGELDADVVFVKNIDNVTTDALRGDTVKYKKALAGMLVELMDRAGGYMRYLKDPSAGNASMEEVKEFIENDLCVKLPSGSSKLSAEDLRIIYMGILNRPMRVCGMVRNEGEPGGGPVWAENADGTVSLQIAETSQIAPAQQSVMASSTHFNPVDLVCGLRDCEGNKFDLANYVDLSAGLITEKSKDGKRLKAQELPGLWNGAMSKWNTVFVEVPVSTFTPVKVVADLLRPQHKNK